jgi:hypothetical protein
VTYNKTYVTRPPRVSLQFRPNHCANFELFLVIHFYYFHQVSGDFKKSHIPFADKNELRSVKYGRLCSYKGPLLYTNIQQNRPHTYNINLCLRVPFWGFKRDVHNISIDRPSGIGGAFLWDDVYPCNDGGGDVWFPWVRRRVGAIWVEEGLAV